MNILVIAEHYPMPDRASGDLRFFTILRTLAAQHKLVFCAYSLQYQAQLVGESDLRRYREALGSCGVAIYAEGVLAALKMGGFDVVFFEFYMTAEKYLDEARFCQPQARIIVDSVDVHFQRLLAKAHLTRNSEDYATAQSTRKIEMTIYRKADVVVAVTADDKKTLLGEAPNLAVEIIPNIHSVEPLPDSQNRVADSLIFVGSFAHDPNVDAMIYFCTEIFPLIKQDVPGVRLKIVGNSPPNSIKDLAQGGIEVLGYVPDTKPHLESSYVSIAPLRYGGGMKGKIGEAMAHGLPVVTTTAGVEGFGLIPEENVLVGDSPEEFTRQIIRLLRDKVLHEKIGRHGWKFILENYSEKAVAAIIYDVLKRTVRRPVKKLPALALFRRTFNQQLERHLLWRFNK